MLGLTAVNGICDLLTVVLSSKCHEFRVWNQEPSENHLGPEKERRHGFLWDARVKLRWRSGNGDKKSAMTYILGLELAWLPSHVRDAAELLCRQHFALHKDEKTRDCVVVGRTYPNQSVVVVLHADVGKLRVCASSRNVVNELLVAMLCCSGAHALRRDQAPVVWRVAIILRQERKVKTSDLDGAAYSVLA